jgi:hypothetical protein
LSFWPHAARLPKNPVDGVAGTVDPSPLVAPGIALVPPVGRAAPGIPGKFGTCAHNVGVPSAMITSPAIHAFPDNVESPPRFTPQLTAGARPSSRAVGRHTALVGLLFVIDR